MPLSGKTIGAPSLIRPLQFSPSPSTGSEDYRDSSDQGRAEDTGTREGAIPPLPKREGITEWVSEGEQGSEQTRWRG